MADVQPTAEITQLLASAVKSSASAPIPIEQFLINLLLTFLIASLLSYVYVKYGNTLSNRKTFARNFILITMTTMLIITIVKSSLALSLGLVGALSIVRFRTAIKEPEELAFVFICISVGLGFGADQGIITSVAVAVIVGVVILRKLYFKQDTQQNLLLTVHSQAPQKIDLDTLVATLKKHCLAVNLKRFDESHEALEAYFIIELENFKQLSDAKSALAQLSPSTRISLLDNTGVF
ncbi:MAG: hypothetical protein BWK78_05685 [Thiotrichaceae bacterium IS1]|nr:MAG: hypothetical protein BWK78_05685 [Thiotrichaceae bacterium IS1]